MKLLRYGPSGQERPGLLDGSGQIRDLSDHVADIDGAALVNGLAGVIAGIDVESLPVVPGSPSGGPDPPLPSSPVRRGHVFDRRSRPCQADRLREV